MQIIEKTNVFTAEEQKVIDNTVLGKDVDWILRPRTIRDPEPGDHPFMSHILVNRNDDDTPGPQMSGLWDFFEPIFHRTRESMGIGYSATLRANLNLTWHMPWAHGVPHRDHYMVDHWNMIFYLTPISTGGTYIFDDDKQILDCSGFEQYSAVAFGGLYHCQGFCAPGETRAVCVVTWIE